MKNRIRSKGFRGQRVVTAAAVASVIAGAAGIMAGQGSAAPPAHAGYGGGYPSNVAKFKTPKLKDGVLEVRGTKASDKITLRLQADRKSTRLNSSHELKSRMPSSA